MLKFFYNLGTIIPTMLHINLNNETTLIFGILILLLGLMLLFSAIKTYYQYRSAAYNLYSQNTINIINLRNTNNDDIHSTLCYVKSTTKAFNSVEKRDIYIARYNRYINNNNADEMYCSINQTTKNNMQGIIKFIEEYSKHSINKVMYINIYDDTTLATSFIIDLIYFSHGKIKSASYIGSSGDYQTTDIICNQTKIKIYRQNVSDSFSIEDLLQMHNMYENSFDDLSEILNSKPQSLSKDQIETVFKYIMSMVFILNISTTHAH